MKEVLPYLKEAGWKISQRTLYRHRRQGLLRPEPAGNFSRKAVDKYASNYLVATGSVEKIADERLHRKKLELEVSLRDEELKIRKFRYGVEIGQYMLIADFDLQMAGRAVVLEAGLKGTFQARAGEFVAMVNGDEKKTGELVRTMLGELDQALNEFATTREFHVIFAANSEAIDD